MDRLLWEQKNERFLVTLFPGTSDAFYMYLAALSYIVDVCVPIACPWFRPSSLTTRSNRVTVAAQFRSRVLRSAPI